MNKPNTFFHYSYCESLQTNFREAYQTLSKKYETNQPLWNNKCDYKTDNFKAIIKHKYVNINFEGQITKTNSNEYNHDKVISISNKWGSGIWHFPMECLSSLCVYDTKTLQNIIIHVTKKTKFVLLWTDMLRIPRENIIDGNTVDGIKDLDVPFKSPVGNPSEDHVQFLRKLVKLQIKVDHKSQSNKCIIIKRSSKRSLKNHNQLELVMKYFCKNNGLELYIHDDSKLPGIQQQIQVFSEASLVIGPHGAGGIFILACKPGTSFIEFCDCDNINICYSRLAFILGINYYGLTSKNSKVS